MNKISFLTICYNRLAHFKTQMAYFENIYLKNERLPFEHIVIISHNEFEQLKLIHNINRWKFFPYKFTTPLNKSQLLNWAEKKTTGSFLVPLDVDLLPLFNIIDFFMGNMPFYNQIVSGYRMLIGKKVTEKLVQTPSNYFIRGDVKNLKKLNLSIAPENSKASLKKQLLNNELFGVCPILSKRSFNTIKGYDENYIGWGAEDQDLIERISLEQGPLVKNFSYLWGHMYHASVPDSWNNPELTKKNREYYYKKRKSILGI